MPVSTVKPEVSDYMDVWQTMRDVINGSRAVKAAGSRYLPMLTRQNRVDYENYKLRADFFAATARASMAMIGFLFRKPPVLNYEKNDQGLIAFEKDATLTGKSFYDLIKDCSQELVDVGRCGVWVDWSDEENRPFALMYEPQDIINWQYTRIGGRTLLTRVVLHEHVPVDDDSPAADEYVQAYLDQWREITLEDDGTVKVTVWRKREQKPQPEYPRMAIGSVGGYWGSMRQLFGTGTGVMGGQGLQGGMQTFDVIETYFPTRGGVNLDRILFTFFGTDGPYPEISKPPLYAMADINLSHYRTSADLENARHFVGVPTPWAAGFTQDGKPAALTLGSSQVWVTSEVNAKCGFLQMSDNFKPLQGGLDAKRLQMSELGIEVITQGVAMRSPEAYATVALRISAQTSGLTAMARSLSQCLTDVFTHVAWYLGKGDTPEDLAVDTNVQMNLDFMAETLQAADLTTLVSAFLQGGISFSTLFYNLQQGEIIEEGISQEEEIARIKAGRTMLGLQPPGGTQGAPASGAQPPPPAAPKPGQRTGQPPAPPARMFPPPPRPPKGVPPVTTQY
jgi:hypothetical protein